MALVVSVLGLSLAGTSLIARLVHGEMDRLRREVEILRNKVASLEADKRKLIGDVEEVRSLLSDSLKKESSLEDRVSVVERLVREGIKGGDGGRGKALRDSVDPHIDLKVIALRKEGLSIREIAKRLGVSKSRVHRIVKKAFPSS